MLRYLCVKFQRLTSFGWQDILINIKVGDPRTKKIVLGILTQSKKAVYVSSYYDKLPMCKISKPNESPSQRYPCDRRTNGRTNECECKPVTKNSYLNTQPTNQKKIL